jgi:hypothetical protein
LGSSVFFLVFVPTSLVRNHDAEADVSKVNRCFVSNLWKLTREGEGLKVGVGWRWLVWRRLPVLGRGVVGTTRLSGSLGGSVEMSAWEVRMVLTVRIDVAR